MPKQKKNEEVVSSSEELEVTTDEGVDATDEESEDQLMQMLKGIASSVESVSDRLSTIENRVEDIENGGVNRFKREALPEDIEAASQTREGVDPKISTIVDEMLGADFGVRVDPLPDQPGLRLTVIVPNRLSGNVIERRPKMETDKNGNLTGRYAKDSLGNVIFEDYIEEDRRSRIISSTQSYDAIKTHCEKVRGNIVNYFSKMNKPLPEFKVR